MTIKYNDSDDYLDRLPIKASLFCVSSLIDGNFWMCYNKLFK